MEGVDSMSVYDTVNSLLVHGMAFAKEGDTKTARYYLEQALLELKMAEPKDRDYGQEAKAWLWLGKISEDSGEKRACFQRALEADMGNPEARRELAILPREAEALWLDPQEEDVGTLRELLLAYPTEEMAACLVSTLVNAAGIDVPECIARAA